MSLKSILATTFSLIASTSIALAQCEGAKEAAAASKDGKSCSAACSEGKKCCQEKTAATAACSEAKLCPKENVASLGEGFVIPAMAYKVGDEVVTCCGKASELAKGDSAKIQFVVGEKTYKEKSEALVAYAEALDEHYNRMLAVEYVVGDACVKCPMEARELAKKNGGKMQYKVASFTFASQETADKALTEAKETAGKVILKRKVGDKEYCCASMAGDAAKKENKPIELMVGDQKIDNEAAARAALARARILAAAEALKKAANS